MIFSSHKLTAGIWSSFLPVVIFSVFESSCGPGSPEAVKKPNILLIMTDDQGFGDLGFHGNRVIQTPVIDSLARSGTAFSQFYVSPVCAPTRSSLMTGRYSIRTGVFDTYNGGAIMSGEEVTIAEYLKKAGYVTAVFGKWHLGDTYPHRPEDQGFDFSAVHSGGGVGQPGDFYENFVRDDSSYFNPVLRFNGQKKQTNGYCSDVFTDYAIEFIKKNHTRPFFAYLAYNAPHTPLQIPQKYYNLYAAMPDTAFQNNDNKYSRDLSARDIEDAKRVYGMVTNIDDNLRKLFQSLADAGAGGNSLIIFLTDNGPQQNRYNAGFRALKGSVYEGGIHVPCFWSWANVIQPGREINIPAAHIDILPTLLEICGIPAREDSPPDGMSLWPAITGNKEALPARDLIYYWTRGYPQPYRNIALRSGKFKLVGQGDYTMKIEDFGLFDLADDPREQQDISALYPDTVRILKEKLDAWYEKIIRNPHLDPIRIEIGTEAENPVILNRNDTKGPMAKKWMDADALGYWEVHVQKEGIYDIEARFFNKLGPGQATFRAGRVQRTINISGDSTDLVNFPDIRLLTGDCIVEAWYEESGNFYAPIYIEINKNL